MEPSELVSSNGEKLRVSVHLDSEEEFEKRRNEAASHIARKFGSPMASSDLKLSRLRSALRLPLRTSEDAVLPFLEPLADSETETPSRKSDTHFRNALKSFQPRKWNLSSRNRLPTLPPISSPVPSPTPSSPISSAFGGKQPRSRPTRAHVKWLFVLVALVFVVNVVPLAYTIAALLRDRGFVPTTAGSLYSSGSGVGINTVNPTAWLEVSLSLLFVFG